MKLANNISRAANTVCFGVKKHSPEILMVAGIFGVIGSTVMACKATTKFSTLLTETNENIDQIHEAVGSPDLPSEYTEEEAKADVKIVRTQLVLEAAKVYAPAVILGMLSISSIFASNNILRKRNVALVAAYTAVDTGFKEYRERVIDRFGKDMDKELKFNLKSKEITETVVDEKGKEKKVKKNVTIIDPNAKSEYSVIFDKNSAGWEPDMSYTLAFLHGRERYANDLLKIRGILFLNEVYEMLDVPKTQAGQIVGWRYDPANKNIDNYVDFGIFDGYREVDDPDEPLERAVVLDFNVDGDVWSRM